MCKFFIDKPLAEKLECEHSLDESNVPMKPSQQPGARMKIFAKTRELEPITLYVHSGTTVEEVKFQIEDRRGIPPDQQRLSLLGKMLEDERKLRDYSIQSESVITCRTSGLRKGRVILVRTITRSTFKVYVQRVTGERIALDVISDDTIKDIKDQIQEKAGIPCDQQRLMFDGKQLERGGTVTDYNIRNESVLRLVQH